MTETKPQASEVPQQESDQKPQIYSVERDLGGWQFNRRDFLSAVSTAAAALAGTAVGCTPGIASTPTPLPPTDTPDPTSTPMATATLTPTSTPTETIVPTRTPWPTKTPTLTATTAPTKTPTPSNTATPTDTPLPPQAMFVSDVTIPDGMVFEPKKTFTKTWRVKNSGSVRWGKGIQLVFVRGSQMDGTSPVKVPDVNPGDTTDISIEMKAPATTGKHIGEWHLQTGKELFLLSLWVTITVASTQAIAPGKEGIKMESQGRTMTLPCGSDIPPGWTCTCNCVTGCSCVGHKSCSCDRVCTCDRVCSCVGKGHYWYPN